ncbi:uncharacterized protein LOC110933965 [Helianthus annuus]|uniref:uncharacterized protein LOC110933965 n=1 Tax=Helianthus annuus TaxID=4232 RepID=UPI000B8F6833|nr:uncharacterized protein LOC110933965 [Helianthus annuus]
METSVVWCARDSGGQKRKVWLDKGTGKACVLISSNGLAITGIDDRRYWSWISTEESRFRSVAYLQQIWWFEVDGEVEFPFPCGTYTLYFRLQLGRSGRRFGRRVCNSDHVHGWDIKPVKFQLSTSDGYGSKHFLCNGRDWKPGITWTLLLDNGADVSSEAEKQRVIMCLKAAVERRAPEGVRLELFKADKPGLLAQVTRTFRENAMNVAQAEISTTMGMALNIFYVTYAIGNPVLLGHYCLIMELMLILGIIVVRSIFRLATLLSWLALLV